MSWYEVESKIKLKEDEVEEFRRRIRKIARFVKNEIKRDTYYAIVKRGYPKKAFRIRKVKDDWVMNFKKWRKDLSDKKIVVKEEFEFELKNTEVFLEFLEDLNFRKWVEKTKHNETYSFGKNCSIELNKVEKLGWFAEIEVLSDKKTIGSSKEKIRKMIKKLGIDESMIDNTGYTKMLYSLKKK